MVFLSIWLVMFFITDYLLGWGLSNSKYKLAAYTSAFKKGGNNAGILTSYLIVIMISCFLAFVIRLLYDVFYA